MEIQPIKNEQAYHTALAEIESLFTAEPDTPDGDRLEVLVLLVEAYEKTHFPIQLPDPIEAIEYHMERLGLSRRDLEPYIGSRARVSEILNRKRPLTLEMIRRLSVGLSIPAAVLVQEYPLQPTLKSLAFVTSASDVLDQVLELESSVAYACGAIVAKTVDLLAPVAADSQSTPYDSLVKNQVFQASVTFARS